MIYLGFFTKRMMVRIGFFYPNDGEDMFTLLVLYEAFCLWIKRRFKIYHSYSSSRVKAWYEVGLEFVHKFYIIIMLLDLSF